MIELIIFIGAGLALAGAGFFIIRRKREENKSATENVWPIPHDQFLVALPEIEQEMIDEGHGEDDYIENVHDCSDITPIWCEKFYKRFVPFVPKGKKLFIYPFSFDREDKPARHQVAAVRTDEGEFYVDTYRLSNGNLLRTLSDNEKLNGYYIYK